MSLSLTLQGKSSLFHPPAQGRCHPKRQVRGCGASGAPQDLPAGQWQNHCPVQPLLVNKRELRAHVQRRQMGTAGFSLSWSWVKKGRAARTDPSCSGGMVLGRYSLCMLCKGEGNCSGIMVLDKRQPSERNLSRKKEFTQIDSFRQVSANKQFKCEKEQGRIL